MRTDYFDLKHMRLGNIEARRIESDKYSHEIVKWRDNPYYGHKDEYTYDPVKNVYNDKSRFRNIDPTLFEIPETCYVIARITDEEEPDVHSVGKRPWELDKDDYRCFCAVLNVLFREN